jgi:glycosyltransferase involved in cell wall biosynthesis
MKNRVAGVYHRLVPRPSPQLLSIVIPIYNEEEVIPLLLERLNMLRTAVGSPVEIILVNDGSTDGTLDLLIAEARKDPGLHVISLSRNFGHQMASTAGLDYARGDAVVLMDGDLQDPPELVLEMLQEYRKGYDVVYAQRTGRESESVFKRASAWLFYRIMRTLVHRDLPMDTGEFRLISRQCLDVLKGMRELHRFMRGMIVWIGFSQTAVQFYRPARARGSTKYSFPKMMRLAWDAAVSFSLLPLRLSFIAGLFLAVLGLLWGCKLVIASGAGSFPGHGWAAAAAIQCIIGGMLLMGIGVLGEYIGRIFEESKSRPLYVVNQRASELHAAASPIEEPERQLRSEEYRALKIHES